MASTTKVPLVGGSADGQTITVELDTNGRPPLTHHHLDGSLGQAEFYELESTSGQESPWQYHYRYRGPVA